MKQDLSPLPREEETTPFLSSDNIITHTNTEEECLVAEYTHCFGDSPCNEDCNSLEITKDYSKKPFIPEIEQALQNNLISLPPESLTHFRPLRVVRKVRVNREKTAIDATDFYCQMQLHSRGIAIPRPVDIFDFGEYGCSFFTDTQSLLSAFSKSSIIRKRRIQIAAGVLSEDLGVLYAVEEPHILLFSYDTSDIASHFSLEGGYTL